MLPTPIIALIFVFVLLLLFSAAWLGAMAAPVDVSQHEQYVAVMRAEEFVLPDNTVGQIPSTFIGLIHMALALQLDNTTRLVTTVWHQVDFATSVIVNGPAAAGHNPTPALQLLPQFVLASGAAAAASNCPIQGSFLIPSASVVLALRMGLLFAQIQTGTATGNLRGQFYPRRDALVAFIGNVPGALSPDRGMAVFRAHRVPNVASFVYLDYWILSTYTGGNFSAITGGANFIPVAVFGQIPAQSTAVTLLITPSFVPPGQQGPVLPLTEVFTGFPLVGVGSSELVLTLDVGGPQIVFSQFCRVAVYTDFNVFLFNATSGSGGAAVVPSLFLLALSLTVVCFLLVDGYPVAVGECNTSVAGGVIFKITGGSPPYPIIPKLARAVAKVPECTYTPPDGVSYRDVDAISKMLKERDHLVPTVSDVVYDTPCHEAYAQKKGHLWRWPEPYCFDYRFHDTPSGEHPPPYGVQL
jgi:hypothetical protein